MISETVLNLCQKVGNLILKTALNFHEREDLVKTAGSACTRHVQPGSFNDAFFYFRTQAGQGFLLGQDK